MQMDHTCKESGTTAECLPCSVSEAFSEMGSPIMGTAISVAANGKTAFIPLCGDLGLKLEKWGDGEWHWPRELTAYIFRQVQAAHEVAEKSMAQA